MPDLEDLEFRIAVLESRVFGVIGQPMADGFITNGYPNDLKTIELLKAEFGSVVVGEPRRTPARSADELKADGIVGLYVGNQ